MKLTAIATVLATSAAFLFISTANAVDNENSATDNTTTNPLTGTETNTKKVTKKHTHPDGSKSTVKVTKTKKTKTNGATEEKKDVETTTTPE
jgi:hypothetical protein